MNQSSVGHRALEVFRVVPAQEFFKKSDTLASSECDARVAVSPFLDDREYRFCKAVVDNPLQASSQYPKLVKISTKTAFTIRQRLIDKGFIRERTLDLARRGRSTILLEASESGIAALALHEQLGHSSCL
jgi:hypothetical protein